jgi:outer membrane murein-binding lipoprotein Lpp
MRLYTLLFNILALLLLSACSNKYIQKTYSDDNEKLTEQITKLNEKIKTIENELKNTKTNAANISPRYGTILQRTSTRQQEETG